MARKVRVEYPGAVYHVYNRGNYRKDLFTDHGARMAFEKTLLEAAESSNWYLHAYTTMSNHYHLLLETPDGNLSCGMHWLQSVVANRFNRFHGERGHVFQGRFDAKPVERGPSMRRVADYIHLNPVRAKLVTLDQLPGYLFSSYHRYWHDPLPERLVRKEILSQLNLPDSRHSLTAYRAWLASRLELPSEAQWTPLAAIKGEWFIGSDSFKDRMSRCLSEKSLPQTLQSSETSCIREASWEIMTLKALGSFGKTEEDIQRSPKLAEWKIRISRILRTHSRATNGWISSRLKMGHPSNVSRYQKRMPKSKV